MSKRHENEQFIRDIQIFDSRNIDFDEWIAQIKKVALLTGKSEYLLALAKSSNTPYKIISQCPKETPWDDMKCKLQEVYLMVAMDYHAAIDLLRKQRASESLQDYITYWTEMCHHSMKMDPSTINNKLVIVLFVKNMYNKVIHRRVAGAKNINTLLGTFKSAQMNLLKLKKYEGLVSDDEHGHKVHTVNQITSKDLDMTDADRSLAQTDGYRQKTPHQLTVIPNRYPINNSKYKCMETHINSSNCTLPLAIHVVYMDT